MFALKKEGLYYVVRNQEGKVIAFWHTKYFTLSYAMNFCAVRYGICNVQFSLLNLI